jgi:hypothetical protein
MNKLLIAFLAILLAAPAYADRGHGWGGGHGGGGWDHGGGGRGWGYGGDWIFPALVGGAIAYDLAQPQTVYVQQPSAPVYAPSVAPQTVQYWYFCAASNAYYPYVSTCPSGWKAVPATPPANVSSDPNSDPNNAPAQ